MALNQTKDLSVDQHLPAAAESREPEIEIDLGGMFLKLIEKWYLLVIAALVGAAIAGVITTQFITPKYTATSKLYLVNSNDTAINLSELQIGTQLVADYVEVFSNWHVHETVMERLGLNYSYKRLNEMVKVTNPSSTRVLYIKVESTNAREAQEMANAYANVAKEFIAVKMGTKEPTVFEEARLPVNPSSPNIRRNILLGFLAGLFVAIAWVVLMFVIDDRIRTPEDIQKLLNLPTLGLVSQQEGAPDSELKDTQKGKKGQKK